MLNIKVAHQGLIIILVPLLCELLALCSILQLIDKTDQVMAQEAISKEIMQEANALTKSLYEGGDAIAGYSFSKKKEDFDKYKKKIGQIQKNYKRLKELSKGSVERTDRVYKLKKYSDRLVTLFVSQGMPVELGGTENKNTSVHSFRQSAGSIYRPLLSTIETIIAKEQILSRKHVREIKQYREQLRTSVIFAIYFSIIISIFLVLYFKRRITTRLSVVHKNLTRFLNKEELHSPIKGKDEIKDLDIAFHDMTSKVLELERRKQEFVSMISHDIRSPITAIQGTLAVTGKGQFGELSSQGKERLLSAEYNIERINSMIDDLLTIDRLESGKIELNFEEAEIYSIVNETIKTIAPQSEKKQIIIENKTTDDSLDCDVFRIEQVIINLITNAIKFSDKGSKISIASEVDDSTATIKVIDQGRGIAEDKLSQVFSRYEQLEATDATEQKGFGLGLAICKGLVESHNGTIGVESEEGKGATFWFSIPRYKDD